MSLAVKICGVSTEAAVDAALEGGAAYLGFVFYQRSPRWVTPARARDLIRHAGRHVRCCGLFVDAEDEAVFRTLDVAEIDILQLHGAEPPERCAQLRERTRRPVMKAVPVAEMSDLRRAEQWQGAADILLFDAKPSSRAALPGGNGEPFDWNLLSGSPIRGPWMLSGGLTAANLVNAVRQTGAQAVDVSSGVETTPGIKDPEMIRAFLAAAQAI